MCCVFCRDGKDLYSPKLCVLYNELRNSLFEGILLDYPQFANLCTKDKFIYLIIY